MCAQSILQKIRLQYHPKLPAVLEAIDECIVEIVRPESSSSIGHNGTLDVLFPHISKQPSLFIQRGAKRQLGPLRVGVVLSGGQAPGGHNVISGLFDALQQLNIGSKLFGFLDGPAGIIDNRQIEITEALLSQYRNQGGFDIIGSGRTKIQSPEQFKAVEMTVRSLKLDGLLIIGGDDSNTNAALLAEYFKATGCTTTVVGVPKTIDGDLKGQGIEISFGFDTASKTYADTIGNIMRDVLSSKKYYFFIKLMGRTASHLTLESALQTHPNLALIAEEVAAKNMTLKEVVAEICDLICRRAQDKKDYGVILIPEGLIEFIPEFKTLIEELNALLSHHSLHSTKIEEMHNKEEATDYIAKFLTPASRGCFDGLPFNIKAQLLIGRDPHGNVQVSKIETERLCIDMVSKELKVRKNAGGYSGKFSAQPLFLGYEGRSCLPTNFDSQYCYALGQTAALLIDAKASGYICSIKKLSKSVEAWEPGGIPIVSMMGIELRHGIPTPVIKKAMVDLDDKPFASFKASRKNWAVNDDYISPGPIQFFGSPELTDSVTITLTLEKE